MKSTQKRLTEEQKLAIFERRYQEEQRRKAKGEEIGIPYSREMEQERRRQIRKIKQAAIYGAAAVLCVLILVFSFLFIKMIVNKLFGEEPANIASGNDVVKPEDGYMANLIRWIEKASNQEQTVPEPEGSTVPENTYDPVKGWRKVENRGLIIVDAGHGGIDPGTSSGDVLEKDLNLPLSYILKDMLEDAGFSVFLTRPLDENVLKPERVRLANEKSEAKAFISLHHDYLDQEEGVANGCTALYTKEDSIALAQAVIDEVSALSGIRNRGIDDKTALVVTRDTNMPSCLIECGFLSTPSELAMLQDEEVQKKIAIGIVRGLIKFLEEEE